MSGYLINTVTIESNSAPQVVKSGTLISDSALITAVQGVGGVIAPSDATVVAAAAVVAKLRARAQNEEQCDLIMTAAFLSSTNVTAVTALNAILKHVVIDIPLATIQAQTSGVAFNIGAVLPANAQLQEAQLTVIATLTGGTISAAKAKVQGGTDTDGSIIGGASGSDVFTATAVFDKSTGSDPYPSRGGQQLKMTLSSTGDTLAHATTGHLQVDVFYNVLA